MNIKELKEAALRASAGAWFVGGTRQKIDRQAALGIFWYDADKKRDENIASVWYDPRNGLGTTDARFIALANPSTILSLIASHDALVEALKNQNEWVRAALECKDWAWDGDQREAAEWSLNDARKVLAALETPANPIEEVVDEPSRS